MSNPEKRMVVDLIHCGALLNAMCSASLKLQSFGAFFYWFFVIRLQIWHPILIRPKCQFAILLHFLLFLWYPLFWNHTTTQRCLSTACRGAPYEGRLARPHSAAGPCEVAASATPLPTHIRCAPQQKLRLWTLVGLLHNFRPSKQKDRKNSMLLPHDCI